MCACKCMFFAFIVIRCSTQYMLCIEGKRLWKIRYNYAFHFSLYFMNIAPKDIFFAIKYCWIRNPPCNTRSICNILIVSNLLLHFLFKILCVTMVHAWYKHEHILNRGSISFEHSMTTSSHLFALWKAQC